MSRIKPEIIVRTIAVSEMIGAVFSIFFLFFGLTSATYHPLLIPIAGFLFCAIAFTFIAGYMLWRNKRTGFRLSIASQMLQVPLIGSSLVQYKIGMGLGGWIVATFGARLGIGLQMYIGGQHYLTFMNYGDIPLTLGVNYVALLFAAWLWRGLKIYWSDASGEEADYEQDDTFSTSDIYPSDLESSLAGWFQTKYPDSSLQTQLSNARVIDNQYTGDGFLIKLHVDEGLPVFEHESMTDDTLPGPRMELETAGLKYDAGSLLRFKDGKIKSLEIFSLEDDLPERIDGFELLQ